MLDVAIDEADVDFVAEYKFRQRIRRPVANDGAVICDRLLRTNIRLMLPFEAGRGHVVEVMVCTREAWNVYIAIELALAQR